MMRIAAGIWLAIFVPLVLLAMATAGMLGFWLLVGSS